jgi:hypothetical protein
MATKQRIFMAPRPGRQIRDHRTMQALPSHGAWVPAESYYHRKLRGGAAADCELAKPPKDAPANPGDLFLGSDQAGKAGKTTTRKGG